MIKQQAQTFLNSAKLVLANEPDDKLSKSVLASVQDLCDKLQPAIDEENQKSVDATSEGVK